MEEFNFSDSDSSLHEAYDDYLLMQDPELEQILHEYGDDLDHLGQEYLHRHPVLPRRINPDILPLIQEKEQLGGGSAQVGGALFRFRLGAILDHRSEHMGVHEQVVPVHLTQNQRADPADHVLAEELSQSLMNSVQELLRRYDRRGNPLEGRDRLYFSIGSQYLTSVYDDWNLTANEWRHPDQQPRFACVLENLAMMLNSNESFRMDRSFTLSLVVVRAPPQGGGKKRRRIYPGVASAFSLPRLKRSILQVPRDDRNMCCAKALWLAYQHKQLDHATFNNRYRRSFRTCPAFQRQACQLQERLGIPPGTVCGPEQLEIFANYFQGLGYYIVVIDSSRAYQGFRYGEGHDPEKALSLYYHDHHYDTMPTIRSFFVPTISVSSVCVLTAVKGLIVAKPTKTIALPVFKTVAKTSCGTVRLITSTATPNVPIAIACSSGQPVINSTDKRTTKDVQPTPPIYPFVRLSSAVHTAANVLFTTVETVFNLFTNAITMNVPRA